MNYNNNKNIDGWLWLGDNAYDGGYNSEYQSNVFSNNTYEDQLKTLSFGQLLETTITIIIFPFLHPLLIMIFLHFQQMENVGVLHQELKNTTPMIMETFISLFSTPTMLVVLQQGQWQRGYKAI